MLEYLQHFIYIFLLLIYLLPTTLVALL